MEYKKKEYSEGLGVTLAQQNLQAHQAQKPGEYQSPWQSQINDLLQKYQNRGPFRYDINADAMYSQMVDRYMQQGKQAMMDTIGQAAALTGGYGNSYAQQVGQQTYQKYLQGVNDMLPQFYNMALDRYQTEGDNLLNQYKLLSDQEDTAYGRYMDALNSWLADRDYLAGRYDSERGFDYGVYEGDRDFDYNSWVNNRDYEYQQERDKVADAQWQREFDESVRQYNENLAWQKQKAAQELAAAMARSSGGGGGSYRTSGGSGAKVDTKSVLNLGYGPISGDTLAGLVASGKVTASQDGGKITVSNAPKPIFGALLPSGYGTLPNIKLNQKKKGGGGR